jgi:transketolase
MSVTTDTQISSRSVNTIRMLAADAIQKANSGHPGMPLGAADIAFVLWTRFLRHDPTRPDWPERDRFVLSGGHGCMLLYVLLHLSGYDVTLDDLKSFRQWNSLTPGHPEFGHTAGVEATTGPLGQGVSNAVGMAVAERMLAARFNRAADAAEAFDPVGHATYVLATDGDIMEGISGEAASLAGHLGLDRLIVLYDANGITIEGETSLTFSEDVGKRYEAYGWHVQEVDGHDHTALSRAIERAQQETSRPSFITCRTHIGFGAPTKQDSASSHGSPLGADEIRNMKDALDWPMEPFHVPEDVSRYFGEIARKGTALRENWERGVERWREANPEAAASWDALHSRDVVEGLTESLMAGAPVGDAATRAHSGAVLQLAAELVPGLVGGSADLEPSNKSFIKGSPVIAAGEFEGRNFHFGIREHAMGALVNGMLYHGTFRPYCATFLIFSDYMRPAIRLAALAGLPAIYVFTHDSIFVGEDGPTHQPIEQAASLRLIPNLHVFRPADGLETALAWGHALSRTDGPTALLLSRQTVPALTRASAEGVSNPHRGAYRIAGSDSPDAIVAATGSEVHIALAAREALASDGRQLNVVSMPCLEVFDGQPAEHRDALFPAGVPVVTLEAGSTAAWKALAGRDGLSLGIDHFGASAPGSELARQFGMTAETVTDRIRQWLAILDTTGKVQAP